MNVRIAKLLVLASLATALPAAAAEFSIHAGASEDGLRRITVNRVLDAVPLAQFGGRPDAAAPGRWRLGLRPELGVSYWRGERGRAAQFSAVPMLRLDTPWRWFVEAGVGVSYFTDTNFSSKDITTRFQFADHLGVGWHLGGTQSVGLRLSHFSNLGIKKPNPGVDALQVTYSFRF